MKWNNHINGDVSITTQRRYMYKTSKFRAMGCPKCGHLMLLINSNRHFVKYYCKHEGKYFDIATHEVKK